MEKTYLFRELVCEKTDKPVEGKVHGIKLKLYEFLIDERQRFLDHHIENFHVGLYSHHLSVVIKRQNGLH